MAKLFGAEYTKDELLKKVGDISQLGGVRLVDLADGRERGVRAADFRTGSGLDFRVSIDRGLDISTAAYKGQSIAWRSSTGDVSPAYYEPQGFGWLRSFPGGLLVTCGFTYAGAPSVDQGNELGLHGRASNIPASNVLADAEWDGDDYTMWVQGKSRECAVFGDNVELTRKITAKLGESKIWLHDKVTNLGYQDSEHMMLYHCNMGFPILDAGSELIAAVSGIRGVSEDAQRELDVHSTFDGPTPAWDERVYYIEMATDADGMVNVALVNPNFNNGQGFGVYMRYLKQELPNFVEWKMTGEGTYVVGMEPGNCEVQGRDKMRAEGKLQFLKPGETREYHLEIGVLSSQMEIADFTKTVQSAKY